MPTILIALIIVNLFAPFSVGVNKNGAPTVKKSTAEAAGVDITGKQEPGATNISIPINFTITRKVTTGNHGMVFLITDKAGTKVQNSTFLNTDNEETSAGNLRTRVSTAYHQGTTQKVLFTPATGGKVIADRAIDFADMKELDNSGLALSFTTTITGLTINTPYYLSYAAYGGTQDDAVTPPVVDYIISTTRTAGEVDTAGTLGVKTSGGGTLPACWLGLTEGISMSGCIAQLIYYLLFVPTSYLFALTGVFFDSTFAYSVNDESYRSPFVVEGWGLVRDFVNMFFIFVLLYIAFSTILAVHGFKTKEMIVNVIIIGLLMNFSLFAGQLIIDSSNILARVFYNSDAIKITKGGVGGVANNTPGTDVGPNGELPLSAALVNKVNPQNLIINASNVGTIPDKAGRSSGEIDQTTGISNGTFILILLLAIAVNIVGMIVFLSVGLIFVARVVGLWIYMILAPFAFFSYTVPSMQGFSLVGWKKWWPEVLSLAFVAPIFIFFLYLILKFLETGLSLINAGGKSGLEFLISVIVPFAFIMILLWKAKGIAQKMSGELGQSITGGVAAIGGLALGGAALGTAFLGRKAIGSTMARMSQSDSAKHLGQERVKFRSNLETWKAQKKAGYAVGAKPTWENHLANSPSIMANGKPVRNNLFTRIGSSLNAKQSRIETIDHERHEIDSVKDKRYKGTEWKDLSGTQQTNVRNDYIKENRSKDAKQVEEQYRNQNGIPTGQTLNATQRQAVTDLNTQVTGAKFDHALSEATKSVGGLNRVLAKANTGSYDARNLSQTKTDKREGMLTKMSAGLIAGVAMGVRTGLKTSDINHGSGQNDLLKDIGHTITEAMKSTKIKVKVEESHGKGGDDGHAGGGGHH